MLKTLVVSLLIVILYIVLGSGTTPTPTQACLDEQHVCNDGDSCCEGLACLRIACMKTWDCETDSCYVNQRKDYVCSNGQNTCMS